jgi:capsid protein
MGGNQLDALQWTPDRTWTPAACLAPDGRALMAQRGALNSLARYLADNVSMIGYALDTIAAYSVPIRPQADSEDGDWNKQAEAIFGDWSTRADFAGRFGFADIQRLVCSGMDLDGDTLPYALAADDGEPRIQLIESHRVVTPKGHEKDPLVQDGVQTDAQGRVTGFHVSIDQNKTRFLPVAQALMMFEPDATRPTAYRGLSPLRRGICDLRDAKDIKSFEKSAAKLNSSLAAAIQNKSGTVPVDIWNVDAQPPPPTQAPPPARSTVAIADLTGGQIPVLAEDEELKQVETNRPGAQTQEFLEVLAGHFVMSLGLPPAFFLDKKLTGPNTRSVNAKATRKFLRRQEAVKIFVAWTWRRVIAWNIAQRRLRAVPDWASLNFQTPSLPTIDAGREAMQSREDVRNGLLTRQDHYGERGLDWQREIEQGLAEDDFIIGRCQAVAKKYGIEPNYVLARYLDSPAIPTGTGLRSSDPADASPPEDEDEDQSGDESEEEERAPARRNGSPR